MFSLVIILCCLGALVSAVPQKVFYNLDEAHVYFEDFLKTYNKQYTTEAEERARFEIFKNNLIVFNERNSMQSSAVFGIDQFADLSTEEFVEQYTGCYAPGGETRCSKYMVNGTLGTAPDSLDWRKQNKVTSVKQQGRCGSCYAFSTVGTVEGQYAIKYNRLVDLSPQQLVDCTRGTFGCKGGWMSTCIMEAQQFGGILAEQDYPYKGREGTCQATPSKIAAKITGCREFVFNSESEIKEPLSQVGPLTVALAATRLAGYKGGILTRSMCDSQLNHALLLVGYGSEAGKPYWIIKNSWGSAWGESGYMRMSMNENTCNLMAGQFVTAVVA